jgi:CBS domain-containing protein
MAWPMLGKVRHALSKEIGMKVEQLMTRDVRACNQDDTLNRAAQLMWEHNCGCVPVVSSNGDGRVLGMLTDRDICMAAYTQGKRLFEVPVTAVMSQRLIACKVGDDLKTIEALMHEGQVHRIPVLDENDRLQGIISINDIAMEFERERLGAGRKEIQGNEVAETLAGICLQRTAPQIQPVAA